MKYLSQKKWNVEHEEKIMQKEDVKRLLLARQELSAEEEAGFFNPSAEDLPSPFLFQEMELACEVVLQTLNNKGKVFIYGDYDCDGISSTALLLRFFRRIGLEADYALPSRLGAGYGLNMNVVEEIIQKAPDLVITVDNGSSAVEEVAMLMKHGIAVIITDHHQVPAKEPHALAFLNPCRPSENYPFDGLAGVGVALQLVRGLCIKLGLDENDESFFSLAALGTVADSMPLVKENRTIVALGLKYFSKAPLGLRLLLESLRPDGKVDAEFLAYSIASRINATGRMDDMEPAILLLLTESEAEAKAEIKNIEELNKERQVLEAALMEEAEKQLAAQSEAEKENILILGDAAWHPGLIGIICARIAEKYALPTICFAGVDGELRGSCRSIGQFDILSALLSAKDLTLTVGGHKYAAGVTLREENREAFSEKVRAYASLHKAEIDELEEEKIFAALPHRLVTEEMLEVISGFEPFGNRNEKPKFLIEDLHIKSIRRVGDGSHLSLRFQAEDGREIPGIAFRLGDLATLYKEGDLVDVLAELHLHSYQNRSFLQLQVYDLRPFAEERLRYDRALAAGKAWRKGVSIQELKIKEEFTSVDFTVDRSRIGLFWLQLEELLPKAGYHFLDIGLLSRTLSVKEKDVFSPFACARMLDILHEASLLDLHSLASGLVKLRRVYHKERPRLSEQKTWQRLEKEGGIVS